MVNNLNFEDRIRKELTSRASEVEISDLMLNSITYRIENDNGGDRSMLKDKFQSVIMRKWIVISLAAVLVICGAMFTFSSDVRAATISVMDKIKTIFVLEESQGEYKIVETTSEDPIFSLACSRTTRLRDEELASKMGFNFTFPKTLSGGYNYEHKSEGVGINKIVSAETSEKLQSDMLKAIDDESAFNSLSEYNPYRTIDAAYKKEGNVIFISLLPSDAMILEQSGRNIPTDIETSVGDAKALWIEVRYPNYKHISENGVGQSDLYTKPDGILMEHRLIWDYNGVRYSIGTYLQFELTMEETVKIAEAFMAAQ